MHARHVTVPLFVVCVIALVVLFGVLADQAGNVQDRFPDSGAAGRGMDALSQSSEARKRTSNFSRLAQLEEVNRKFREASAELDRKNAEYERLKERLRRSERLVAELGSQLLRRHGVEPEPTDGQPAFTEPAVADGDEPLEPSMPADSSDAATPAESDTVSAARLEALQAEIERQVTALLDDQQLVQQSLVTALIASGAGSVPALTSLLKSENAEVRYLAAYALGEIGPAAGDALPALREARNDPNADVRQQVEYSIGAVSQ